LCWEQIAGGDRFALHEGAGLGVWRKPGGSDGNDSPLLSTIFSGSSEDQEYVRRHYLIYNGYLRSTLAKTRTESKIAELSKEVQASRHELMALEMELKHAQFERNEARREIKRLESLLPAVGERSQLQDEVTRLSALLESERKTLRGLTHSLSWRVTRPIRRLSEMARGYK
jgi:chromosome segregation ATPase